jgi:hypothetical protein
MSVDNPDRPDDDATEGEIPVESDTLHEDNAQEMEVTPEQRTEEPRYPQPEEP